MSNRVFLTGGSGFIGGFLKHHLANAGFAVTAPDSLLSDKSAFEASFKSSSWDAVIHLAAISAFQPCQDAPYEALAVNLAGTAYLANLVLQHSPQAHFVFSSTAQIYRAPEGADSSHVIDESWPVLPASTYAKSKMLAESCLRDLSSAFGLKVTALRLFNHTHKSQAPDFFLPYIYSKIATAPKGSRVEIPVGNVDLKRDFGSIYDLARAFQGILNSGGSLQRFNVFNVCSGQARNLRTLAELLADRLGVTIEFKVDSARIRPGEALSLRGSSQKLKAVIGWQPEVVTDSDLINAFLL